MRRFFNLAALGIALAFLSPGQINLAFAEENLPRLLPEPGVSAHVERRKEGYVLVQPDGSQLVLLDSDWLNGLDGPVGFKTGDYDFDGYTDFASSGREAGSLDVGVAIYLYNPKVKAFSPLIIEDELGGKLNCGELWNVERIPERKLIKSSCSLDGHYSRVDILSIDRDQTVRLVEQSRPEEQMFGWPYLTKPMRMVTYDAQGNSVLEVPLAPDETEQGWEVPREKLTLYSNPDRQSATSSHLARGDKVRKLAYAGDDWMKIAYQDKTGPLEGWISLKEAYDLTVWQADNGQKPQSLELGLADYSGVDKDRDYYKHLFTLTLANESREAVELSYGELHLIFTSADGQQTTHKLYDLFNKTLEPGKSETLDDNPVQKRNGQYVIYHPVDDDDAYSSFFPEGLAVGKYKIRPVVTGPNLKNPIYGLDEIEMNYPPELPDSLIEP
ncbi:hypothetical protein [Brucella tritici]|uniref:hypothetical protein n=1 Tax=Brucella tritici TaxID=94626 RepID=UPI003D6D5503